MITVYRDNKMNFYHVQDKVIHPNINEPVATIRTINRQGEVPILIVPLASIEAIIKYNGWLSKGTLPNVND